MTLPRPFSALGALLAFALAAWRSFAQEAIVSAHEARFETIRQIRALPPEAATPPGEVLVGGVVTYSSPFELFIQDGPDAIFVGPLAGRTFRQGDYVRVSGLVRRGHFAPLLAEGKVEVVAARGLPHPQAATYRDLASGEYDCRWVEARGVVRSVQDGANGASMLRVGMPDGILQVRVDPGRRLVAREIVGLTVTVRGVASGVKNLRKQLIEPVLYSMGGDADLRIESPPEGARLPPSPISAGHLLQHGAPRRPTDLVRVQGSVTRQTAPDCVFIADGQCRLEIQLQQPAHYAEGQRIEAVGFPAMGRIQPQLEDAVVTVIGQEAPPAPAGVGAADLLTGRYEGALVRVQARVRESFRRADHHVLVLAESGVVFEAVIERPADWKASDFPEIGALVAATGICQVNSVATSPEMVLTASSVRLLLQGAGDVTALQAAPWWTAQRLRIAAAGLACLSAASGAWIWTLNRRVRAQTRVILHKAQTEAALEERHRIAREFHDTLEQDLAAVTIQLDAAATALTQRPDLASGPLTVARAMVRHSLEDAQRAVCDLRCASLGARTLPEAIAQFISTAGEVHGLPITLTQRGERRTAGSVAETHLLRIVQESVANAVKHAQASKIDVRLEYGPDALRLEVIDDGIGLESAISTGADSRGGGFGILGMRERAAKLGARLTISSEAPRGARIAVTMPLPGPPRHSSAL